MNTLHIYKKELRSYFNSPIAYVFIFFFLLITGSFFLLSMLRYAQFSGLATQNMQMMQRMNTLDMVTTPLFSLMAFLLIFLLPVISMGLFSEEKKLGTIELLFTYPITEFQLVIGKFLAAVTVLVVIYGFTFVYFALFLRYFYPDPSGATGFVMIYNFVKNWLRTGPWGVIGAGYLGIFLVSLSFLSFGIWVSSLFKDQITAGLTTIGGLLIFWIIGSGRMAAKGVLADIFSELSLVEHYQSFARGIIDTHDVVFYLCFIFLFLFLTIQGLEIRKWKG